MAAQPVNLPDLGKISNQLATQNARVQRYIDTLPKRIDSLVAAASSGDWREVRRLGEFLATTSVIYDCNEITHAARRMCAELDGPAEPIAVKRSLVRLIAKCGSARAASVTA